ncbi:MAG: tetratricopeptide repeat protein [Bryobacterales bacterium]|nr:tetratricopeptide repeat protein [Bryobacterales bacterium]
MRWILTSTVLLLSLPAVRAAEPGQLDASPTLFTVMAALNAAGYDADLHSPNNHPLRHEIRKKLAARDIPIRDGLRQYFESHRKQPATADLSQYISFALVSEGPPNFRLRMRTIDRPPDVGPLTDFGDLLQVFYEQANIAALWQESQPAIDAVIDRYHEPVTEAVFQVNAYLRNVTSGYLGRRFQIYLDLLAPPNQVHTRTYGDEYYIVITPSPDLRVEDIRRAYLYYLIDATATKYGEELMAKRSLIDFAEGAAALAEHYKNDFILLATMSLVRAVESRLDRAKGAAYVQQSVEEGFILTAHFAEQLALFEKQELAFRLYFPEMVESIDLRKETKRLDQVTFASAPAERKVRRVEPPPPPVLTGAAKQLEEAEELYSNRNLEAARLSFLKVLEQTGERKVHARAYYGLARIAVLQRDPELGFRLFEKALELGPEPEVKGWVLVYLGRLSGAAGEAGDAARYFNEVLAVDGASEAARKAAQQGMPVNSQKNKE